MTELHDFLDGFLNGNRGWCIVYLPYRRKRRLKAAPATFVLVKEIQGKMAASSNFKSANRRVVLPYVLSKVSYIWCVI